MESLLAALEASPPAGTLRRSLWLYPAANVAHVLGIMGFFAAVAAMDVRLLRARSLTAAQHGIARLRPLAAGLLGLQVLTGLLLFLPEASHIAHNPFFRLKLLAILAALANIALLETALRGRFPSLPPPPAIRASALASMALWLVVAALGRLIAYV